MATERAGSPDDLIIQKALAELEAYLQRLDRSRIYCVLLYVSLTLFIVPLIAGGLYLDYENRGLGYQLFEPDRTAGLDWALYIDYYGPSRFLAVFWFIIAYWAVWIAIGLLWRDFGVYAALKSKRRDRPLLDFFGYYAEQIVTAIRSGKIRQMSELKPSRIVGQTALRQAAIGFPLALVATGIFGGIWYLDRMDYRLLTDNYIEYTDYWTSRVHRIRYSDVSAVNVTCRGKNKDKLVLYYEIEFADGKSALVANFGSPRHFRERLPGHLQNWARADASIRAGGGQFVYPVFNSILITDRQEFNPEQCIAGLDALVGKPVRDKVMALLAKPQTPSGNAVQ